MEKKTHGWYDGVDCRRGLNVKLKHAELNACWMLIGNKYPVSSISERFLSLNVIYDFVHKNRRRLFSVEDTNMLITVPIFCVSW